MAYATVTLTGSYQFIDGSPARGRIDIQPTAAPVKDTGGDVVMSGGLEIQLDTDGHFSIALPATDDPALDPTGFGYTVTAKLSHGHLPPVTFALPASLGTLDMADVTPADPQVTYVPIGSTDAGTAAWVKDPASATRAALSATIAAAVDPAIAAEEARAEATYVQQAAQDFTNAGLARLGLAKKQITWLTTFQAGHGYTIDGGGLASSNANDTTDPALGTQSVSVVSKGTTTAAMNIYKTGLTAIDFTNRDPVVWVKLSDLSKFAYTGIQLASDAGFANQYQWSYGPDSPRPPMFTNGDWVALTFPFAQAGIVGAPNRAAITAVKLVTGDTTSGPITATFGGIGHVPEPVTKYPNGAIVICLDDCYPAHWSIAWPKLSAAGQKATVFPILSSIGVGSNTTLAQLKTMHDRGGWEIGAHGTSPTVHTSGIPVLSPTDRTTELNTLRNWLLGNAFEADSYAYPSGFFDAASCADVNLRFTSGRTIYPKYETYPVGARDRLRSQSLTNTHTLAQLQAIVDKVKANRSAMVFTVHDIKAAPSAVLEVQQAAFEGMIDYAIAQGVPLITQRELMLA